MNFQNDVIFRIINNSNESEFLHINMSGSCISVVLRVSNIGASMPFVESKSDCIIILSFVMVWINDSMPFVESKSDCIRLDFQSNYFYVCYDCNCKYTKICYLQIHNLNEILTTNEWGYYMPSTNKNKFFKEIKYGYSIAYGKHRNKYKWLLCVKSNPDILRVLLSDIKDIKITFDI